MPLVSVAVPVPFLGALSYRVPHGIPVPLAGVRVRVPLGTRMVVGWVVEQVQGDGGGLKTIADVLDEKPFLPREIMDLCRWVADYYVCGIGDAIGAAMPPGVRDKLSGHRTRRVAAITVHGLTALRAGAGPSATLGSDRRVSSERGLTAKQKAALDVLAAAPAGLPLGTLRDRGITADAVGRLAARGFVTLRDETDERNPFERSVVAAVEPDVVRELTSEQVAALGRLHALTDTRSFHTALLHGVTGSGKTEVYRRLAEYVVRSGRQVLMLVPEISLTPAVAAVFRGTFGARIAIQHSGLSDGERHDQWQRIRRGLVDVVVGTRSAVFTPLRNVGLVIVDEEHDSSYKQEETPRYNGRDVAIVRASRAGALAVLGSATPSMESYQRATSGKYVLLTLERRVLERPLATVRLVNMRDEYAAEGPDVVISRELAAAIEERLARREQSIVLLNRRGYATAVFCRQCGDTFACPNCSVSLTVHGSHGALWSGSRERDGRPGDARARCHYCNYTMRVPKACRKCAAPYLELAGFGTEKVEQHLCDRFPAARIGRVDRDSVRRKGVLASLLSRFGAGDLDILVGTQMIAKGHDFAGVTLVGVISADVGLGVADFRAAERTFQLLTQVAGRAGRGQLTGEAIVQTLYPRHYSIQLACRQDYPAFFARELGYRRAMRYPPLLSMVNAVVRGRSFSDAMNAASDLVQRIEPASVAGSFQILGPAPAALTRLRGEHRVQFFLKGTHRAAMRHALETVLSGTPELRRRVTIDVDPLSVL